MEKWLPVRDVKGYEVSNDGRVKNSKTGRIMKTYVGTRGYESVCLRDNKHQVTKRVHRLVADAFYDGEHDGFDVNHIDGNKLNNHVSNLEFCTRKENINHAFRTGLKKPSRMIKVRIIETGEEYDSLRECARRIGCDVAMISQYLSGELHHVKGYHFEKII